MTESNINSIIRFKEIVNLSKRQLSDLGSQHAKTLLDEGYSDAVVLVTQARKAIEFLKGFDAQCDSIAREELTRDGVEMEIYGAKLSLSSTGDRLDYDADPVYKQIKSQLKAREDMLKLARNAAEEFYDGEGIAVPRVPIKSHSKEVLKVKL